MSEEKIQPFNSFETAYKILIWAGYYKLIHKPRNKIIWLLHQIYRPASFLVALVYNLQHIIFIVQRRDNINDVFDCLMIQISQINLLVKYLAVNLQISRIDAMNHLINSAVFRANSKEDETLLLENNRFMNRLCKTINIGISFLGIVWPPFHCYRRYLDPNAVVPIYVPFDTDTWFKFSMSIVCEVGPLLWIGYGHVALDIIVAVYYAQAEVQLKIIKHNLEHLFDVKDVEAGEESFKYRDDIDSDLKERFVHYIQRFEKVAWLTKETNEVFSPSMFTQFFTASVIMCCLVYRLSFTPAASIPFVFMIYLLFMASSQVFVYCYFGNLVHHESQSIVCSLYLSDWVSVSPKFRRLLLIAMLRWSRQLTPVVAGLIPISLNTFVTILRSAYSLYAVLGAKN